MSRKTSTPSMPSDPQVGKLHERLLAAARKSGVSLQQFQAALSYPGTELDDDLLNVIVRFARKANGIITPVAAKDTGLIPNGWEVESESLEGDIDLANMDYSFCPVREGESHIDGDTLLQRAREAGAFGSLGLAAKLLKAQDEGKEIFPVESRGKHYFIMPRTKLRDHDGHRCVPCFYGDGLRWVLLFDWLVIDFYSFVRLLRARE